MNCYRRLSEIRSYANYGADHFKLKIKIILQVKGDEIKITRMSLVKLITFG